MNGLSNLFYRHMAAGGIILISIQELSLTTTFYKNFEKKTWLDWAKGSFSPISCFLSPVLNQPTLGRPQPRRKVCSVIAPLLLLFRDMLPANLQYGVAIMTKPLIVMTSFGDKFHRCILHCMIPPLICSKFSTNQPDPMMCFCWFSEFCKWSKRHI